MAENRIAKRALVSSAGEASGKLLTWLKSNAAYRERISMWWKEYGDRVACCVVPLKYMLFAVGTFEALDLIYFFPARLDEGECRDQLGCGWWC